MTLQATILEDLARHGRSTAAQIAERTGLPVRSVRTALTWMRGNRLVRDNSVNTRIEVGWVHHKPPGPVEWEAE